MIADDTTEELLRERARLGRRARIGGAVLAARTVLLQLTVLVGNVFLLRTLAPRDFGIFGVAQAAVAFFAIFGDGGLGVALIAKKGTPPQRELSSVFWLQMLLAGAVVGVLELIAPWLTRIWPDLSGNVGVLRALAVTLLLTVVKVPPAILMERELDFVRIASIEFFGRTTYFLVAVILAMKGYGTRALVFAILAEGVLTTILAYALRPWRPTFVFDRALVAPIVRYGVAYQTRALVSAANTAITPLLAGAALGLTRFGLLAWAFTTATFPMEVVNIVGRVALPLYARLQSDRIGLTRAIERSIQVCSLATMLFAGLILGLGDRIVPILYTDKWLPALPSLRVYVVALTIGFGAPVVAHVFDASGKPGVVTRLSFLWVALNWVVVPVVLFFFRDMLPFALAYSVHMIVGNVLVGWAVKRAYPDLRFLRTMLPGMLGGAAVALTWLVVPKSFIAGPVTLALALLASAIPFVAGALVGDRGIVGELRGFFAKT